VFRTSPSSLGLFRSTVKALKHRAHQRRERESGYVVVVTAILLTVLLLFIALGLDSSQFRDRTSNVQRVADAAALAGASGLPDIAVARARAQEAVRANDPSGRLVAVVDPVPGKPGRIKVVVKDANVKSLAGSFGVRDGQLEVTGFAEQSVGIPMGTPYNSIGTGDLLGTVPGKPLEKQGYFLAVNGPCTAKEDGDRYMARYEGTRGSLTANGSQNSDAYHCTEDQRAISQSNQLWTDGTGLGHTLTKRDQWKRNSEYREGGYSFVVNVPCDGPGVCVPGTTLLNPVNVDVWDPWFRAWYAETPCPVADRTTSPASSCVVDKIPLAVPDNNWVRAGMANNFFKTKFAIYDTQADGAFSSTPFATATYGADNAKWIAENAISDPSANFTCGWDPTVWTARRGGAPLTLDPATGRPTCKDWFAAFDTPITKSGRYRVQVAGDPVDVPPEYNATSNIQFKGPGSFGLNTFALRVRPTTQNANTWTPCAQTAATPSCPTITGEGALSVYVKTPGNSDLFLTRMAPPQDYRGRTIQIQLWDPGEGAQAIKVMMPVDSSVDASGYKSIDFKWSTGDPGLYGFDDPAASRVYVQDRDEGWTSGIRTPVATSSGNGVSVSGSYDGDQPWPAAQRYSQARFNGRLLLLDVTIPASYGQDASGNDVPSSAFNDGWWKIRYESGGNVEDRTTWTVQSTGGPVHLVRGDD
jgi:hypothetical protein